MEGFAFHEVLMCLGLSAPEKVSGWANWLAGSAMKLTNLKPLNRINQPFS
jgi:hypothetical protein